MEQSTVMDLYQVAEIELIYKSKVAAKDRPHVLKSQEAYKILLQTWDSNTIELTEHLKVLLLNIRNRVLGIYHVSSGGTAGTVADPKLIFSAALKANASRIILAHNHPSGNLKPSQQDLILTQRIKEAGRFLDIQLMDHIIIANDGYYSLADNGEL